MDYTVCSGALSLLSRQHSSGQLLMIRRSVGRPAHCDASKVEQPLRAPSLVLDMHAVELAHQPQPELAKQAPQVGRVSQESAATVAQRAIDAARSSRSMGIAACWEAEGAKSMGSVRGGVF